MPALPPKARYAHFDPGNLPPGAPQPYEWWYFEFHFPAPPLGPGGQPSSGAPVDDWVVVLSCHLPHFIDPVRMVDVTLSDPPGSDMVHPPFAYSGIATSIYRLSPTVPLIDSLVGFSATRTATAQAERDATAPFSASWGSAPVKCRIDQTSASPLTYRLRVEQAGWWSARGLVDKIFQGRQASPVTIRMDLTLVQNAPGFAVTPDAVLMTDKHGGKHHWAVIMPDAHVTGNLTISDGTRTMVDVPVDSIAYHDHQWGPHLPVLVMNRWSWGRALVHPDGTAPGREDLLVFFEAEPMPGPGAQGGRHLTYVPAGGTAVNLQATDPATPTLRMGGWDDDNYPLEGFDAAQARWPAERNLPSVSGTVEMGGPPRVGPPFPVPPDDSRPNWLRQLIMAFARPLARRSLRGGVGYHGVVACQGEDPSPTPVTAPIQAAFMQRGATVEPWPFYNRYIPSVAVSNPATGAREHRVTFGLSEFMEAHELLDKPPLRIAGNTVYTSLLGMGAFSEAMTQVEPGAPRFWDTLWRHFWP